MSALAYIGNSCWDGDDEIEKVPFFSGFTRLSCFQVSILFYNDAVFCDLWLFVLLLFQWFLINTHNTEYCAACPF